jgi:hypothetical protein
MMGDTAGILECFLWRCRAELAALLSLVLEFTYATRCVLRASFWFADDHGWVELQRSCILSFGAC